MNDANEFQLTEGEVTALHNLTHSDLWPVLEVWAQKRMGMLANRIDDAKLEDVDVIRGERRCLKMIRQLKKITADLRAELERQRPK